MASDVVFRYDAGFKYTLNYASTLVQTKAWSPTENHSTTMATPKYQIVLKPCEEFDHYDYYASFYPKEND